MCLLRVLIVSSLIQVLYCISPGGSPYRRGDDVSDLWLGRYMEQQSRGRRVTEEPESRDDWETIVRYNEKILQQEKDPTYDDQLPQPTKIVPRRNDTTGHLRRVSCCVERSNYKPPKPPTPPTPPQRPPRRLLPVLQFLNRQVSSLLPLLRPREGAKHCDVSV